MRNRIVLAAVASGVALAAVVGVAMGVGRDEPRLVRSAGTSTPLEETSTTSTGPSAVEAEKVAELDATVEDHEARISQLEATTTTATPAATPTTTATTAPAAEVVPESSTTTTTNTAPPMTQPAPTTTTRPTTTTTRMMEPWWCRPDGRTWVPCDSTTTTTAPEDQ